MLAFRNADTMDRVGAETPNSCVPTPAKIRPLSKNMWFSYIKIAESRLLHTDMYLRMLICGTMLLKGEDVS